MGSALPRRLTEFLRRRVDDRRPAERPRVLVRRDGDAARHFRNIWRHRQPSAELLLARPVQKVTVNILLVNIHRTQIEDFVRRRSSTVRMTSCLTGLDSPT